MTLSSVMSGARYMVNLNKTVKNKNTKLAVDAITEKFSFKFISEWLCTGDSWWKVVPCTGSSSSRGAVADCCSFCTWNKQWCEIGSLASVLSHTIVTDLAIQQPGFNQLYFTFHLIWWRFYASGNALVLINIVPLCQAHLVHVNVRVLLGWPWKQRLVQSTASTEAIFIVAQCTTPVCVKCL